MSQIQIREVINNFCKIISAFKFSPITAEELRLAKFNKSNVDFKMWKFLYELLLYISNNKEPIQEFDMNIDSIRKIQVDLIKLGYNNSDFNYTCESLRESDGSSREILLACAWLISTQDLINLFIKNMNNFFEEEYFKGIIKAEKELDELDAQIDHLKLEHEKIEDDVNLKLNYLKRLEHRYKLKLNSLHSCLREKSKLTYQIHDSSKFSQPKLFGNLSCHHIYLIKNKEHVQKFEKVLEEKLDLLTSVEYWLDNEDIFWEWMESVVDEKLENCNKNDWIASDLNLLLDDEDAKRVLNEKKNLDKLLSNLKLYAKSLKQKIIDENLDANLNSQNSEMLKIFQDKLEDDFKQILESDNLMSCVNSSNRILLSINSFENRLVLDRSKQLNNKSKLQSIQDELNHLENKINFLKLIYLENKKNIQSIIEKHINDLKDSYAIFF